MSLALFFSINHGGGWCWWVKVRITWFHRWCWLRCIFIDWHLLRVSRRWNEFSFLFTAFTSLPRFQQIERWDYRVSRPVGIFQLTLVIKRRWFTSICVFTSTWMKCCTRDSITYYWQDSGTHVIPLASCLHINWVSIDSPAWDKMLWRGLLITLLLTLFILRADAINCPKVVTFAVKNLDKGPLSRTISCILRADKNKEYYTLSLKFKSGEICSNIMVWYRGYKEDTMKLSGRGSCKKA